MAEGGLVYRAASHGLALTAHAGVLEIAECEGLARYVLRAGEGVFGSLAEALGLPSDLRINRALSAHGYTALHLGPDEWLLLAEFDQAGELAARVGNAAKGRPHSLVDVSHRSAGLRFAGPAAVDALACGCPQNLELAAFGVDKCSRSVFVRAEIVLWRRAEHVFHVEIWRSFVPYVVARIASETVLL